MKGGDVTLGKRGAVLFRGVRETKRRGERSLALYHLFYRLPGKEFAPIPRAHQFFSYADRFAWGDEDQDAILQLAAVLLYSFFLKERNLPNGKQTAALVTEDMVRSFAARHLAPLKSASWTLQGHTIEHFVLSQPKPQK